MTVVDAGIRKTMEIEGPAFTRFLFNNSRAGLFWLPIRLFLGFNWLEAGWGKFTGTGWMDGGDVSFELAPKGAEVLLTVTHRRLADRKNTLMFGAGWHMHLDILMARASGEEPAPFWDGWSRLKQDYDRRLPA